jgi:pimeloyl-ACP methyl ester carboxylesterase
MAWSVRAIRPQARMALTLPYPVVSSMARTCLQTSGNVSTIATRSLLTQIADADAEFLRWGTRAILSWQPSPGIGRVPIHQIHGGRDRVFPASRSKADVIIPDAGHLLSVTHGGAVNQFIAQRMSSYVHFVPMQ